jgi:F-type H+-transporting ATPase subunit b
MNNPLVQPDPGLAIWTIITFLVLLYFLAKFAWRPLLRMLQVREDTIRKSLDDAKQAKQELERLTQESAQIIRNAHTEAGSIIARSRSDGEKLREEIKQKARLEGENIIREARRQIEAETGKALRQIRGEIADMSVAIASKLTHRNLTREDNSQLIEETLKQIEAGMRPS